MDTKLPLGKYIFEWGGLIENAGGMTRAMLKRANVFIGENVRPTILLSARGLEQYDRVNHYKKNGYSLICESDFLCMEDYFGTRMMNNTLQHSIGQLDELYMLPYEEKDNCIIYYKDGAMYAKKESVSERFCIIQIYDKNGEYNYADYYWNNNLRRRIYSKEGNKKIEKYYAENGFCFLTMQNSFENEKWIVKKITLLDENNKSVVHFESIDRFRQFFFSEYVCSCEEKEIFVFCDPFLDFNPGFQYMNMPDKNIYRIAVNHGVGFGGERKWYSQINPRIKDTIINAYPPEIEAFILLTKESMDVFRKRIGNCDFLYNVPNTIVIPEKIVSFEERDLDKIVYVGRFGEKQKQISHVIKAFAKAAEKNGKIHLHLYGRGEDEELYRKLIHDLDMDGRVFIEGFSNQVSEVYQSAGFTVFSSDFEGFSLSLLEAMANACVPISYDFCYGPKDAIVDGVNGLIVQRNNIDELAEKINLLSENHDLLEKMSEQTYKSVQKYKEENYLANWEKVLASVVARYKYKNHIKDMQTSVQKIVILPESNVRKVEILAYVIGVIPEIAQDNFKFSIRLYNSQKTDFEVKDCNVSKIEDGKYSLAIVLSNRIDGDISVCLEWDNTFIEKNICL